MRPTPERHKGASARPRWRTSPWTVWKHSSRPNFPKTGPAPLINLVRYADDFIITARSKKLLEERVRPS